MKDSGMLRPRRLCEGDTVAALSPSWGGPAVFPRVFDLGLRNLREHFGVKTKEFPTTRMSAEALDEGPEPRPELPVLANADFGHTEPQWVLPLGIWAELDGNAGALRLLEPAVT
ncbi:MAG: hypothetical protein ACO1SV_13530 [Fimbriimonas sp.]